MKSKNFIVVIVLLLMAWPAVLAQKKIEMKNFRSKFAREANQKIERDRLTTNIEKLFDFDKKPFSERELIKLFEEIKIKYIRTQKIWDGINFILSNFNNYSENFIYETIELAFTIYPADFNGAIKSIFNTTDSEKIFGLSGYCLFRNKIVLAQDIINSMNLKFPSWKKNPFLKEINSDLSGIKTQLPPIEDLLKNKFQENKTIIYSFHRKDRNFPGLTIIKGPDGEFVRNENGQVFRVVQLAKSVNNLPGYFPRGNTPQGIFSVVGYYISPTESLSPTPIVLTRTPFEVATDIFFHKQIKGRWKFEYYQNLLPQSWKEYSPIHEAFKAGAAGRKLIIMHGSADDLDYYKDQPYFPLTPSFGCLTTKEMWDSKSGKCVESDQVKLMNAFFSTKKLKGFLVVVEIDDQKAPVKFEEIEKYLKSAE